MTEEKPNQSGDKDSINLCYVDVEDLKLSSQEPLKAMQRQNCPKCNKRQSFFCFDCVIPLTPGVPKLELPVKVEVVQHGESNAKATGTQAALLAPDHVTLRRHADGSSHHRRTDPLALALPDYDPQRTVVLYPEDKDTPCIGTPEAGSFDTALVLEGSWQKAKGLLMRHPKLQGLRKVQLPGDVRTVYWRRGAGSFKGVIDEGVCTIECIYYLCRALDPTPGKYDDLLWYFTHIRSLVLKQAAPMTAHYLGQLEEARRARHGAGSSSGAEGQQGAAAGGTCDQLGEGAQQQQQQQEGQQQEATAGRRKRKAEERLEREQARLAQQRAFKEQLQQQGPPPSAEPAGDHAQAHEGSEGPVPS